MNNISIRPYQPQDREALRTLCCDVADRGNPIENFFSDRDLAADVLTGYYTDYEPEAIFVAECDGRLAGYITASLDNRRYGLVMFWILFPVALAKAFKHGVFFRPEVWTMIKGALKNWRRMFVWRKTSFHSHQGHLHIGIARDFRHQKVGERLMEALVHYAAGRHVGELGASVHDGNIPASRFFEHLGFSVRERYPMIMVRDGQLEHYHSLFYVKKITAH